MVDKGIINVVMFFIPISLLLFSTIYVIQSKFSDDKDSIFNKYKYLKGSIAAGIFLFIIPFIVFRLSSSKKQYM